MAIAGIAAALVTIVWVPPGGVTRSLAGPDPRDGEHPGVLEHPSGRPPVWPDQATPFVSVTLPNGDTLSFYELTGRDGEVTFAVAGREHAGNPSAVGRPEVATTTLLELFNAVSQPGTPIPRQLSTAFGVARRGPQGWLLGALEPSGSHIDWCDAATFQDHIDDIASYYGHSHTLVRVNERPADHPERWAPYNHPQFTTSAWLYEARRYNVYGFYTRVALCHLQSSLLYCFNPFACVPYGPWIDFEYRDANNQPGSWGVAFLEDASGAEVGDSFWWLFYTGVGWDWKTRIWGAEDHEKFNIALTWAE